MAGRGYLYNSSQGVVGTIIFVEITRTFIIAAEVVSITFTIIGLQLLVNDDRGVEAKLSGHVGA
jgi:hypothetical protein